MKKLATAHGYTEKMIAKIAKIQWPAGYTPGDAGEESTNQEGQGATLKSVYKASSRRVS